MFKILICIVFFFIIPAMIGFFFTHFMKKEKNTLSYSLIIGYITEFSICQLFAIPYIFMGKSFEFLYNTCLIIYIILSVISLIINFKEIINILKKIKNGILGFFNIWGIIAILLIGFQCFVVFNYMHIDADDANFVAKATITLDTNTLYKYDDAGRELEQLPYRNGLSPFPVYTAIISKFTGIHPMIIAHTVFPVVLTLLMYCTYYLLGMKLFKNDKYSVNIFLIFVNLVYCFGNVSSWINFSRVFIRFWQGKTVLGDFILPAIIVLYDSFSRGKAKFIYSIVLINVMLSACLVSTMGFALAPIMLWILTIIYSIRTLKIKFKVVKSKKIIAVISMLITSIICCIPPIVYATLHLMLKEGDL